MIASRSRAEMVLEYTDRTPVETLPALPAPRRFIRKHWLTVAAAAALLAIGAFFFLHRREPVALSATDTVVIADFTNSTGDSVFDDTLRQGLAVQLEQSPFLGLVPEVEVEQALTLMGQSPNARLTLELARQVCERIGGAAVLHGSIAMLGKQHVLGLRANDCRTGDTLADEQAQAENKEDVLKALSKIAGNTRTRLGESLARAWLQAAPMRSLRQRRIPGRLNSPERDNLPGKAVAPYTSSSVLQITTLPNLPLGS